MMRNLFVKGLPKALVEQHLRKLFSRCGTVSTVAVLRTKRGASRGVAMVAMESNEQAANAVALLHGRWLHECEPDKEWCIERECGAAEESEDGKGGLNAEQPSGGTAKKNVLSVEIAWKEPLSAEEIAARQANAKPKEDPKIKQQQCQVNRKERLLKKQAELEANVPEEERDALITKQKVEAMRKRFGDDPMLRCDRCWLLNHQCICAPTPPAVAAGFKHKVIIYLHCKEYGRLSNTGGLLLVAYPPPQTQIMVAGLEEDEERFREALKAAGEDCIVMFPSPDALTVQQLLAQPRRQRHSEGTADTGEEGHSTPGGEGGGGDGGAERGEGERQLTIILIDGTWPQARRLHGRIPESVQRVVLQPREEGAVDPLYKSPMRSQATPDRICSLTAFVMLVQELGAPPVVSEYLLGLLHHKSLVVLGNSNKQWKQTDGVKKKKGKARQSRREQGAAAEAGQGNAQEEVVVEEEGDGASTDEELLGVGEGDAAGGKAAS